MRMKKIVALLLALAMMCGMLSGMSLTSVSAATLTLTENYKQAMNEWLLGIDTWNTFRAENYIVCYQSGYDAKDSWYQTYYTGANRTATNPHGVEFAVNKYGYVTVIEDGVGNMAIPEGGYVLSGNGTGADRIRNAVSSGALKVGVRVGLSEGSNSQYRVYAVTDDDKLLGENVTQSVSYSNLGGSYANSIIHGSDTAKTGTNYWQNYLLCKQTGTTDAGYPTGYSVKRINASQPVPAGYFAVVLPGQTANDAGQPGYNAAMLLKDYGSAGSIVTCGVNELYFRYDVAAAVRAAHLLTGLTNDTVTEVYDFSANTILTDAKTKFELVDTDRMQALYDNMVAVTNAVNTSMTVSEIKPYMATIYQNYDEICALEYEVRTVEMRATWTRPLPNDRVERTVEELDALLTESIQTSKARGYNMIFVEAAYNSTVIFPVPETVGYEGLSFNQNPYLVPTSMGGLNSKLTEPYDMLQRFIDICKENDVEPHIWWEVFYVGYTRTDPSVTDSYFDYSVAKVIKEDTTGKYENWLNVGSNGDLYYGAQTDGALQYFLNPASTGARTFLMNTFKYIWNTYDVDSFQLDYIRYPHTNSAKSFGYDADTLAAFKASKYYDASVHTDAYLRSYSGFFDADWVQFRADYVTSFVKEIKDTMKEVAPDLYLTSSPGAEPEESKKNIMQDVTYWLQNDYIDIIFPMAYGENVPGLVSAGLVADNSTHFVCTGVSGSYLNNDMEARWMKEVRDAGTDGLATFVEIPDYVDYVWSKPAVTPTGSATIAAKTYLSDTVTARADQMLKLNGVTDAQYADIKAAATALDETINLYGIDADETLTAINALQAVADELDTNAQAALTKDVNYIKKIRNNSRDIAKQNRELKDDTLTVNGVSITEKSADFSYVSATDTLYVKTDKAVLSGELNDNVTVVLADTVNNITFDTLYIGSDTLAVDAANEALTVKLVHSSVVTAATLSDTTIKYIGFGELNNGADLVMRKADVDVDGKVNSSDVRSMMKHVVKAEVFTADQIAIGDVDGDGKVNTIDARKVLAHTLGL